MEASIAALLFGAGMVGGAVNALAGGATLLTHLIQRSEVRFEI